MIKLKELLSEAPFGKKEKSDKPSPDSSGEQSSKKLKINIPDEPFSGGEDKINETLPAYANEWKGLEKACYDLEKAVTMLSKSVGRQDKSSGKIITNTYKTLQKSIKGYKEMLKKNVLSRLQ